MTQAPPGRKQAKRPPFGQGRRLSLGIGVAVVVALWISNPTLSDYQRFLEHRLDASLARVDPSLQGQERQTVEAALGTRGHQLLASLVRQHTRRYTVGIGSLYVSEVAETRMISIGIGSLFLPLEGVDAGVLRIGRLIFQG